MRTVLFNLSYVFYIATSLQMHSAGRCTESSWPVSFTPDCPHNFAQHHSLFLLCAITPKTPSTQSSISAIPSGDTHVESSHLSLINKKVKNKEKGKKGKRKKGGGIINTFLFSYWMHALVNIYFCYYRTSFCDFEWPAYQSHFLKIFIHLREKESTHMHTSMRKGWIEGQEFPLS